VALRSATERTALRVRAGSAPLQRTTSAVEVVDLNVVRGGRPVLRGLTFDVATATVTGLLGPSGCGKTTLMRAVVGAQRIACGEVRVLGHPAGSAAVRARVGYVTQAPAVYTDLSVEENLHYFGRLLGVGATRVTEVIELVDLASHATSVVARLSGGEQARVSLATALLGNPELLVLDEPTVGLDPVLRHELWQLFHSLAAGGTTILVSSHVMDEAARCSRLLLMRDGALLADGTPAELRSSTGTGDLEEAFLRLVRQHDDGRGAGS
jgi:ABC-2 type transport system ATP-binding protein